MALNETYVYLQELNREDVIKRNDDNLLNLIADF